MATDSDRDRTDIVFDPSALHPGFARLQLKRFLIKFPRPFFVRNGDGDKSNFLDHQHTPLWFSGFNLWIINLFPSGSCTTAIRQQGVSNGSAANRTWRSFNCLIASSKSSTSNAAPVPCSDGNQ